MNKAARSLDELVDAVQASAKYAPISAALIRSIGSRELAGKRSLKDAVKATKNKLHQVAGAYFTSPIDYAVALEELRHATGSGDQAALRQTCRDIMRLHASTKERLGILDRFYATILAGLQAPRVVIDIASGLNPLAIPWMSLDSDAEYYAYDIYADMANFTSEFLKLIGVRGGGEVRDVIQAPPEQKADLALMLKCLPCLEQIDPSAGFRLLDALNADHVVVSFPVRSLGGARKGMLASYERRFYQLVEEESWVVQKFEFESELAFLIDKNG